MGAIKLLRLLVLCAVFLLTYYFSRSFLSHDLTAPIPLLNPIIKNVHGSINNSSTENVVNIQNLTSPSPIILMYNKVPKCSSTTMYTLIKSLSVRNQFQVHIPYAIGGRQPSQEQQEKLLNGYLKNVGISHAYVVHMYFFDDVGNYNGTLVWMNMVRDPVERVISGFNLKKRDINKCILEDPPSCFNREYQFTYFCGKNPACKQWGNRWALQRAMYHVEKYYSVVGIFEERALTYALLEAFIPKFFRGFKELEPEKLKTHAYDVEKRGDKETITNATRALMKNKLKEDYELYEFLRQRLYTQAKSIGLL